MLLPLDEVAARLGVAPPTVLMWLHRDLDFPQPVPTHLLPPHLVGHGPWWRHDELERWADEVRPPPGTQGTPGNAGPELGRPEAP
ncbi:MAG: helix-turn-helix domain-containing protein [Acidobacteria bacterium]|nr:helix-turn-helix domain-containing protein [Acidobacteriota bacterium]